MGLYAVGARVSHQQYGDGTVTRADEYHTVIDFDQHGPRTFSSSRAVLTTATTPAPVKVKATRKRRVTATAS